jgi:hypothetical protein
MTRRTWRLVLFVHEWARCEAESGERVGIERFAGWSVDSRRTAYSRLVEFRAAFPELGPTGTPSDLIVWPAPAPAPELLDRVEWAAAA